MSELKIATELRAKKLTVVCPHCGKEDDGWLGDPRGQKETCQHCNNEYQVHIDADIEYI
jgi:transposase-like protein